MTALASFFGVQDESNTSRAILQRISRVRGPVLLVLDNLEQQLGGGDYSKDIAEVRASAHRLLTSLDDAETEFERLAHHYTIPLEDKNF